MDALREIWIGLSRNARIAVSAALGVALCAIAAATYWLYRPDYQVLFSDLAARDSAAMVAELDKMKVPYRLGQGGAAILVPAEHVYKTRLQLVGRDIPLQGAVGFELFNNSDMGMTDFAQKVNYQRALQGELTRTIQSLAEVQAVRVHILLPERGLLRGAASDGGKVSIALTLKPHRGITREQVLGIQRLVAAAVPEVKPDRVVVVDEQGAALAAGEGDDDGAKAQAGGDKKEMEEYLARKAAAVLDQTFGAGRGLVKVDAVVNQEHTRVTTESVLPSNASAARPAGVVVREQESGPAEPVTSAPGAERSAATAGTVTREVHYQAGRRVEQIVSGPGVITRLNVAVIVREKLDAAQADRIRELVGMAVGLNPARGDGIAVYSIDQLGARTGPPLGTPVDEAAAQGEHAPRATAHESALRVPEGSMAAAALMLAGLAGLAIVAKMQGRRRRNAATVRQAQLSDAQRQALLANVQRWAERADVPEVVQ
jgi:flagellar M-ring protein FliF